MTDILLPILTSLTALMVEETALLAGGARPSEVAPLASAKLRLVGELEAAGAEQDRLTPDWLASLPATDRSQVRAEVSALRAAAEANAAALRRQLDLSRDLLGEIANEARRLSGTRQKTYRNSGVLQQSDNPSPVAVNTRL